MFSLVFNIKNLLLLGVFWLTALCALASGAASEILDKWLPQKPSYSRMVLFYQKDCSGCHQQFKALDCIKKVKNLDLLLVGAGTDRLYLRKVALLHDLPYKIISFAAAKRFAIVGTPSALLTVNGPWRHFHGLVTCQEVHALVSKLVAK